MFFDCSSIRAGMVSSSLFSFLRRDFAISRYNLVVVDVAAHLEERRPPCIGLDLLREVAEQQERLRLFCRQPTQELRDLLLVLTLFHRHIVDEIVGDMACAFRRFRAALFRPFLVEVLADADDRADRFHGELGAVVKVVRVARLRGEIFLAGRGRSAKQPAHGVRDCGLACAVRAVDGGIIALEVNGERFHAAKVFED